MHAHYFGLRWIPSVAVKASTGERSDSFGDGSTTRHVDPTPVCKRGRWYSRYTCYPEAARHAPSDTPAVPGQQPVEDHEHQSVKPGSLVFVLAGV